MAIFVDHMNMFDTKGYSGGMAMESIDQENLGNVSSEEWEIGGHTKYQRLQCQ